MALQFQAVTPGGAVAEQEADSVTLPTADGEITVLPHHIPLVSVLIPGVVTVRSGEQNRHYAVSSGFIQVTGEAVTVLADTAERSDAIDVARAERAWKAATEAVERRAAEIESDAKASLARNAARLKAAELAKVGRRNT